MTIRQFYLFAIDLLFALILTCQLSESSAQARGYTPIPEAPDGSGPKIHSGGGNPAHRHRSAADEWKVEPSEDRSGCGLEPTYEQFIRCMDFLDIVCDHELTMLRIKSLDYERLLEKYNSASRSDKPRILVNTYHHYRFASQCIHAGIVKDAQRLAERKASLLREIKELDK